MLMRLWMFGTGFIYAQKGLWEMLYLMNCIQRSMLFSLCCLFYNFSHKTNSCGLLGKFTLGHIHVFITLHPSLLCLRLSLNTWTQAAAIMSMVHPVCFLSSLFLSRWQRIMSKWWDMMNEDPFSSPVRRYWWIDKSMRLSFCVLPFLCYFYFTCHYGWNEPMLTETPTQTLAATQLIETMNADSNSFVFFNHLTLFYLDIIQQHHNQWKALQPWALKGSENCFLYSTNLLCMWAGTEFIELASTVFAAFPMIWIVLKLRDWC